MPRTPGAKNKPKTPERIAELAAARAAKKAAAAGGSGAAEAAKPTAAQKKAAAKAATAAATAAPAAGSNSEKLTDDMQKALAGIHQREFNRAKAAANEASNQFRTIQSRIKAEGGDVKQIKVMNELESEAGEARVRESLERILKAAKWKQSKLGDQFNLDIDGVDRTPIDDRAFADGKADGLSGEPPDNKKYQGPLLQRYMAGYHEGNIAFAATLELFRPKPGTEGQGTLIEGNKAGAAATQQDQAGENLADAVDLDEGDADFKEVDDHPDSGAVDDHRDNGGGSTDSGHGNQQSADVKEAKQPETLEQIADRIESEDRARMANAGLDAGAPVDGADLLTGGGIAGEIDPARQATGGEPEKDLRPPYLRDQSDERARLAHEADLAAGRVKEPA